mmetsp:Transcript_1230/g.1241  ORF Transcript_1230/g.1241 Transcript_1230/m.1241 type:complete len:106 (-) Transcript_1230:79-396(-)
MSEIANVGDPVESDEGIVDDDIRQVPEEPNEPIKGVGVFVCTLTLLGTRMGGGIVGIPFATLQLGFVTAIIIQIVLFLAAISSIGLYLRVRTLTGRSSLSDIGLF